MAQKTVLHIEDDPAIGRVVAEALAQEGLQVVTAADAATGLEEALRVKPDLVILDLLLPDASGLDLCAKLRSESNIPVLVLSVKSDEVDTVLGLEMGADDYLPKPFSTRELVARVRAMLRRLTVIQQASAREKTLEFPGLIIDVPTHSITLDGQSVHLTPKEFGLLYFLASQPRHVFTREQLADEVWRRELSATAIRTVDTHVKRIRQKLESDRYHPWSIASVWGVGYKFEVDP